MYARRRSGPRRRAALTRPGAAFMKRMLRPFNRDFVAPARRHGPEAHRRSPHPRTSWPRVLAASHKPVNRSFRASSSEPPASRAKARTTTMSCLAGSSSSAGVRRRSQPGSGALMTDLVEELGVDISACNRAPNEVRNGTSEPVVAVDVGEPTWVVERQVHHLGPPGCPRRACTDASSDAAATNPLPASTEQPR